MKKILIVEDELSIAELEKDYLELSGYEVDLSHTGKEGLSLALSGKYDLILLDVLLPEMDGFELCKQIRASLEVPILMVSAKKEEIDKIKGLGFGADDYITKPFSPSELVARVKAHLGRYERLRSGPDRNAHEISIRGLRLDRQSRRVYVNDNEVILTAKEFDLLLYMAQHPNRVFSKEVLFERIWEFNPSGDIATVTVHIRRIREKIEAQPSNPQYIETIWGAGYRFTV